MDAIGKLLSEQLPDAAEGSEHQKYYYHFNLGLEAYSANQHENALKYFERCLKIARDLVDRDLLEFFAYYGLGYSHALNSRYGQTVDCFNKCLNRSQQITSRDSNGVSGKSFAAFAYIALGDSELFLGHSKKALTFFESGLKLAAQMHDNERELVCYLKLADVYKTISQFPKALENYNKCFEKAEGKTDNPIVLRTRLRAHQGLGDVCNQTGKFHEALKHYKESLKILSTINDDEDKLIYEKSLIFAAMGYLFGHTGQSTKAVSYYEMCKEFSHELGNKSLAARTYLGLGHVFVVTGKCFEATVNFEKCLEIALELNDKHLEATAKVGHGDVHLLTGDISTAIDYYQESLEIADESELCDVKRTSHLGLGNAYATTGEYPKAVQHLEECLKLSVEVGDQYHECQVYLGLGDVKMFDGRYEAALENFKKGLHIAVEIAERNCQSRAKRSLGDALTIFPKTNDAIEHYEEALTIAEDIDSTHEKSRSHLGLGKAFKSLGRYEEALKHYEKGIALATEMSERNLETNDSCIHQDQTNQKASNDYMKGLPFANLLGNKFGALTAYWELGDLFNELKEHQKALKVLEMYLSIAEETNDFDAQEKACKRMVELWTIEGRTYMATQFILKQLAIAENRQKSTFETPKKRPRNVWKWEKSSISHRETFKKLLKYGQEHPDEVKEINGVRVCCSEEFDIGKGNDGTRVYVGIGKDGYEKAVKRMPRDTCESFAEQEKNVLNEPNLTQSNHVINYWFLDEKSDKDNVYLILDLCEETLKEFVDRSDLNDLTSTAKNIIQHLLKGLAALHSNPVPILHRDLKPSNILRNVHNNWLLADFGISRMLKGGSSTHSSEQRGTNDYRAVESYPTVDMTDEEEVRYKKESDIQVAGIVAFYIVTKGGHPFGEERYRLDNLLNGNPVNLDTLEDPALKDLLTWMLSYDPSDRPSAEEALTHPYFQTAEKQFEMLCKIGNQHEIKTGNTSSHVVRKLNNNPKDWRTLMRPDVLSYMCTDYMHRRPFNYGSTWTECLRLMRNVKEHWYDRPRPLPQPAAFYLIGDPGEYFLNLFPKFPVEVHKIIRSCDWKERTELQKYFICGVRD